MAGIAMTRATTAALALLALLGGAPPGDSAGDGFAPRLRAELGRYERTGAPVILDVSHGTGQPAMARVTFVVPEGQRFKVPQAGRRVGEMALAVIPTAGANRAAALLSGALVAVAPASELSKGCVRQPTARLRAVLRAAPSSRGSVRRLTLHLFVRDNGGSTRVTVCLPRLDALSGRSAVRRLVLRLERGLALPAAGRSVWRGLFTPVGKGGGAAAQRLTTESRGILVSPSFLTLQLTSGPSARRGSRLAVAGSLSVGSADAGRALRVLAGRTPSTLRVVGRTRTRKFGVFSSSTRAPARAGNLFLQARAPSRAAKCSGRTPDAPAGCKSATVGGVSSGIIKVRIR